MNEGDKNRKMNVDVKSKRNNAEDNRKMRINAEFVKSKLEELAMSKIGCVNSKKESSKKREGGKKSKKERDAGKRKPGDHQRRRTLDTVPQITIQNQSQISKLERKCPTKGRTKMMNMNVECRNTIDN
jgi:hypothetical protein